MRKYARVCPNLVSCAIAGICLIATAAAATSVQAAIPVDKIAAGVNNEVILQSDVQRFERTLSLRKELDPLFGFSAELVSGKLTRDKVIDFLVQEQLILQSFKVTDDEVEQEVQSVMRNNNLTRKELEEFLKGKGFKYNDYFELMRVGLAKRYLLDREIRNRVSISNEDIKNYYYNTVMKESSVPLEYSLQLIAIDNANYKTSTAAAETAQRALRSVRQGEQFAEVARRVSDDPSKEQGGDLGYLPAEQLSPQLKSAVRGLQIGGVSEVLKTPTGYMIIKLVDARSAETKKFKEVQDQLREQLAKEEYKKQLHIWAERARNGAYVYVN